ncbi:hypothetical protein PMZ80_004349 [Knufia obscura]|uniref:DUF6594 domain-containing protein n=1 Tax=Knufia obscura TaxID=1635080 RepID=A0ABR0RSH2_9EURO|nr:hypothetical protein PMZ80_004349 [Knufia obscura]
MVCGIANGPDEQLWFQSQITRLPQPLNSDVHWLHHWMFSTENGDLQFMNLEREIFAKLPAEGLIAIKAREYSDSLTRLFATKLILAYHHCLGKYIHQASALLSFLTLLTERQVSSDAVLVKNTVYTSRGNDRLMAALTAGLSSAFPVLSIVILNQCKSQNLRLGVLALFTILFSIILSLVSSKKKLEVFAAAAAFAAVNVVFIK